MPQPALIGTYPIPSFPDATMTAGWPYTDDLLARWFSTGRPVHRVCDIETYGVGADAGLGRIKCVVFASENEAVLLNPRDPHDHHLTAKTVDYSASLTMHKANFDAPSLAVNGLLHPHHVDKVVCSLVLARIATPGTTVQKDLDACVLRYLGIKSGKIMDLFKALGYKNKTEGFLKLDIDAPAYQMGACSDGIATARILPLLYQACIDQFTLGHPFTRHGLDAAGAAREIEKLQIKNRWGIERTIDGIAVDFDFLEQYRNKVSRQRTDGEASLRAVGIDPGNGNHLTAHLEKIGALPADHRKTKTGKYGAAQEDLEVLHHPIAKTFMQVKEWTKVEDDYLVKCVNLADENGRIHPTTDIAMAAHGRDSMSGWPVHQIPGPARGILIPDAGTQWGSVDWSQQEPRIAMNLAGDHRALHAYENLGEKIYTGVAAHAQVSMPVAKIVVLAGLYGRGLKAMSDQLALPPDPWVPEALGWGGRIRKAHWGYQAAKDIKDSTFSAIPATAKLMDDVKRMAREVGKVWTVNGRILPIPMGSYTNEDGETTVSRQAHKGINFMVCGSAADEMTDVIVAARGMGLGQEVKWGMHDELIVNYEIVHDIRRLMETPSERFCFLAGRRPVIRTDTDGPWDRWEKPE